MRMIGLVDVGGGLRGIYGAGVMDYCLDHGIRFGYGIGVSAGSANIISYAAGQRGRNYHYFIDYSFRKEYMSVGNFLKKRCYLDMDYIYGTLYRKDGERPLDYPAVAASDMRLYVVATSALTGEPVYFTKEDLSQDRYDIIKASCSIPIVNRPYPVDGVPFYDGGISDPIPFRKALADGCSRVVVILTRPTEEKRKEGPARLFSHALRREFPQAADRVCRRLELYRQQLEDLEQCRRQGRALVIAPETIYGMKTLTKDRKILQRLYDDGYRAAEQIETFIPKTEESR